MTEYLILCHTKRPVSNFPDHRLIKFDHLPQTDEVVEAVNKAYAEDPIFYKDSVLTSYRLHAIDQRITDYQFREAKIVFIGPGTHHYLFVYSRNCAGHITHGYFQITLDQPITEENLQEKYEIANLTISSYIHDPLSCYKILLHCPVK